MLQLTDEQEKLAAHLEADVRHLSENIGERNMHNGKMEETAAWIEKRVQNAGYTPYRQAYQLQHWTFRGKMADNIIAELSGGDNSEEIIIVGAHYDSVLHSPGANDNASAVAVLLALAEWFRDRPHHKTIRFVFFANEEPPFFKTKDMGSYAYAREANEKDEAIAAMIALDGLGYFSEEKGSQTYPLPGLGLFYPKKANFIGFVSRIKDRNLMNKCLENFRSATSLNTEGAALPGIIPGASWSDHWSFWQFDYPALMITDTLPFRDPAYHSAGDTAERLDYRRMTLVAEGLKKVISQLASGEQP